MSLRRRIRRRRESGFARASRIIDRLDPVQRNAWEACVELLRRTNRAPQQVGLIILDGDQAGARWVDPVRLARVVEQEFGVRMGWTDDLLAWPSTSAPIVSFLPDGGRVLSMLVADGAITLSAGGAA